MSQVHRYCQKGAVTIEIGLIQWIESVTNVDTAPPPGVISPLVARVEGDRDDMRNPEFDEELVADTRKALDGCWLCLDEIHAIQQLRGWHRARYGRVTVDAYWLARARNVLDNLTLSLEGECEEMLEEYGLSRVGVIPQFPVPPQWQSAHVRERAAILKSMQETDTCGECQWCQALRLRDRCDGILDNAGYDGGSRYNAYCQPRSSVAA